MTLIGMRLLVPAVAALLLGGAFAAGAPRALAQEAGGGYPAGIHAGTCGDFDPAPLYPLTSPVALAADSVGADEATTVVRSRSVVPVPLEELLAEDHVIVVRGADAELDSPASTSIACGEIGGLRRSEEAGLVIGLREVNESLFAGLAIAGPNPDDPAETVVTLYVFERRP